MFYVVQWGYEVFGQGLSEEEALTMARENGLTFELENVKHISGSSRKLVTAEGDELANGMIVILTESQKNQYWD